MAEWLVEVRDAHLNRVGEIDDYQQLKMIPRFNAVGSWVLDVDNRTSAADALAAQGAGITVRRDGEHFFSGPVRERVRTRTGDTSRLQLSGPDDLCWLAERLARPVTSGPPYTTAAYDVRTGAAETVLLAYVNFNAGAAARADRRVAGLVLPADQARGATVTGRARFPVLLDLCASIALSGGGLGFRIVQVGQTLQLQVYEPQDRSDTAIFSEELGNLGDFSYAESWDGVNHATVGGSGEGTGRVFVEAFKSDSIAARGLRETFVDKRETSNTTELAQAGAEELERASDQTSLSLSPIDTEAVAFGTHWGLGDIVTVVADGVPIVDVVRDVTITLAAGAPEQVKPLVGTPGATDPRVPRMFAAVRALKQRTSQLERR